MAVPAPACEQFNQSSSSLEFEELFELELDELFEFELDELFELEFEELLELEFDELFEFELDELFELEFEELLELELEFEPFLPLLLHQPPSSSATRRNSSCWLVAVPPGADAARCGLVSLTGSIWRAWAAPVVPRSSPRAAVVSHVILLMGGISLCGFLVLVRRHPVIGRVTRADGSCRQTRLDVSEEDETGAGRPLNSDERRIVLE